MRLEYFLYAISNIWHRKLRSFLNVLSILIGIAAVFALISFGQGLSSYVDNLAKKAGTDKMFAQPGGFGGIQDQFFFSKSEVDFLGKVNGITQTAPVYIGALQVEKDQKSKYTMGFGMSPGEDLRFIEESLTLSIIEGRGLKKGDNNKVVLGYNYRIPDKLFKRQIKAGDKIKINENIVEVVGFYDEMGNPQDDSQVYMTLDTFEMLFPEKKEKYYMVMMRSEPGLDPAKVAERAQDKLRKLRGQKKGEEDFYIQTFEQAIQTFNSILSIINSVLVLIAAISIVVATVNIMNTMYTAIVERTKEIGVMKAIGARNSEILLIFIIESGILGFLGSVFGVLLGYALASLGGSIAAGAGYSLLKPVFPIWLILGCLIFGLAIGCIAGFFPAKAASKLKPVDALRYE